MPFLLLFSLLAAVVVLAGCDFLNKPLKAELIEYTEKAAFSSTDFENTFPRDEDGILSIPSSFTGKLQFFLRNPQQYQFTIQTAFDSALSPPPAEGSDYTTVQTDPTIIALGFDSAFLRPLEGGGDLNPVLSLIEPRSGRTFGPYGIPLRVNSVPEPAANATVMQAGSGAHAGTYILCFNMPDMSGIHQDTEELIINGDDFEVDNSSPAANNTGLSAHSEFAFNTTGMDLQPAKTGGPIFEGSNPRSAYYPTGINLAAGDTAFTLTLVDQKGLSSSVTVSTNSQKLEKPTASPPDGSTLEQNAGGFGVVTLRAPAAAPDAQIHYTATPNSGSNVFTGQGSGSAQVNLPSGGWTITARASKAGFVDSDTATFTYTVVSTSLFVSQLSGSDTTGDGSSGNPFLTVQKAVDTISTQGSGGSNYTIFIMDDLDDFSSPSYMSNNNALINIAPTQTINLTIKSSAAGTERRIDASRNSSQTGRVMYIGANANVTLADLTLTGGYIAADGGGVYVNGGSLTMNSGTIGANETTGTAGGGVYINGGGSFTMSGGTISSNKATGGNGGGVYVASSAADSTFIMGGGTISRNTATLSATGTGRGGGVYVAPGGDFTMQGTALITRNEAAEGGGGVFRAGGFFAMKGSAKITANEAPSGGGVYINGGATPFTMSENAQIAGNAATGSGGGVYLNHEMTMAGGTIGGSDPADGNTAVGDGGGVHVGSMGRLTLSGGTISSNSTERSGGGINVLNGGQVTMGGSARIIKNTAKASGGAVCVNIASFTMDGGIIGGDSSSANSAENGGAVSLASNGTSSTFTMNGGIISHNTASSAGGAVHISLYTAFNMAGGTISNNTAISGGGVLVSPSGSFTMSGGTIKNNTAISGGGVRMEGGTFTMTNSSSAIGGNSALDGGGVFVGGGTFTMNDGLIGGSDSAAGNKTTAGGSGGGGVFVNSGQFILKGGTISYNETFAGYAGGGVYVYSGSTFTMSGGSIKNNTAGNGGGVYVDGTFNLSGNSTITANKKGSDANNVYLPTGKIISVTGALGATAKIDVTMQNALPYTFTNGYNTYNSSVHPASWFTSDAVLLVTRSPSGEAQFSDPTASVNIANKDDLINIYNAIKTMPGSFTGTITLNTNIDMSSVTDFKGFGNSAGNFSGTFDGNHNSITNLNITAESKKYAGFIQELASGGTVKNLTIESGTITGSGYDTGGIVGRNSGTIENCVNKASVRNNGPAAGIVGISAFSSTIKNCANLGTVTSSTSYAAGIVGFLTNSSSVSNCYNDGTISSDVRGGGIVGIAQTTGKISQCYNSGTVGPMSSSSSNTQFGGIAGFFDNNAGTIENCYNTGAIGVSTSKMVGGIVGARFSGTNNPAVNNCYNVGTLSGSADVGGIVGYKEGTLTVTACYFLSGAGAANGIGNPAGNLGTTSISVANFGDTTITWGGAAPWKRKTGLPSVNGVTARPVLNGVGTDGS